MMTKFRIVDASYASSSIETRLASNNSDNVDGNGDGGGMEERIARLEKAVDKLQSDVSDIRVDMATVKENIRHLPTKPWLFTTLASMVTIMIVLLTFIIAVIVRFLPHAP